MESGSKRKIVSCTNNEKCGMMCAKGGEECIEEALSNLFKQGFFDVFPERSERANRRFASLRPL